MASEGALRGTINYPGLIPSAKQGVNFLTLYQCVTRSRGRSITFFFYSRSVNAKN